MLSRFQIVFIIIFTGLFLTLLFAFDTKPRKHKLIETSRASEQDNVKADEYLALARAALSPEEILELQNLEGENTNSQEETEDISSLEAIAGTWYKFGFPLISGIYAERIAGFKQEDENAWSIAGTTFTIALKGNLNEEQKVFSREKAINAFEMAISLNPGNIKHKINKALVYTSFPLEENPMLGIQSLLELNRNFPENVSVINQLAYLAIETGQYDRAIERFKQSLDLENENKDAVCGIAIAFQETGDAEKAATYAEKCKSF